MIVYKYLHFTHDKRLMKWVEIVEIFRGNISPDIMPFMRALKKHLFEIRIMIIVLFFLIKWMHFWCSKYLAKIKYINGIVYSNIIK